MPIESNQYEILKTKVICDILDGDTMCGDIVFSDLFQFEKVRMPQLDEKEIDEISELFGMPQKDIQEECDKWKRLADLIDFCIKSNKCSSLLTYLFDKTRILTSEQFLLHDPISREYAYTDFSEEIADKLNSYLRIDGKELVVINNRYDVVEIDNEFLPFAPNIDTADSKIIKQLQKTLKSVTDKRYDDALSDASSFLEYVCFDMIVKRGEDPEKDIGLVNKYARVTKLYPYIHTDKEANKVLNSLLSGLHTIVNSVGKMRVDYGDDHARKMGDIEMDEHHVRLCVNAAISVGDFLLSVEKNYMEPNESSETNQPKSEEDSSEE